MSDSADSDRGLRAEIAEVTYRELGDMVNRDYLIDALMPVIESAVDAARADALAVCAALLGKVLDYWDGRPSATIGQHIKADLRDVLRAIEGDLDHNRNRVTPPGDDTLKPG